MKPGIEFLFGKWVALSHLTFFKFPFPHLEVLPSQDVYLAFIPYLLKVDVSWYPALTWRVVDFLNNLLLLLKDGKPKCFADSLISRWDRKYNVLFICHDSPSYTWMPRPVPACIISRADSFLSISHGYDIIIIVIINFKMGNVKYISGESGVMTHR